MWPQLLILSWMAWGFVKNVTQVKQRHEQSMRTIGYIAAVGWFWLLFWVLAAGGFWRPLTGG